MRHPRTSSWHHRKHFDPGTLNNGVRKPPLWLTKESPSDRLSTAQPTTQCRSSQDIAGLHCAVRQRHLIALLNSWYDCWRMAGHDTRTSYQRRKVYRKCQIRAWVGYRWSRPSPPLGLRQWLNIPGNPVREYSEQRRSPKHCVSHITNARMRF
jgi:hypothetical protein